MTLPPLLLDDDCDRGGTYYADIIVETAPVYTATIPIKL
jgi:hypothetical protein